MTTLTLLGWYHRHNSGDEAFKRVHAALFPDLDLEWVNDSTPLAPRKRLWVLGAGDVLKDFYLKRVPGTDPFFVYGCGVAGEGEIDFLQRNRDRLLGVWLRNAGDAERIAALGLPCRYSPDIVFQLRGRLRDRPGEDPAGPLRRKRLVVLVSANAAQDAGRRGDLRRVFYYEYLKRELAHLCDYLSAFYDVVLYPLSTDRNDDDHLFALEVAREMSHPQRPLVLPGDDSLEDTVAMIRHAGLVLTMKFHGVVFAILSGVPFINIGLSRKTQLLCQESGLGELCVEPYSFCADRLKAKIKIAELPETRLRIDQVGARREELAAAEGAAFRQAVLKHLAD